MAGLDARQVEDVVDQCQQIVVGREDRTGVLHLFFGERAVLVVGQQLGQDQRAVQRRAQFVRHVGQELGLVARCRGQFVAVAHQLALRDQQRLLLRLQLVGALFQLHVALFQLGLLFFQVALRLQQAAALLFQLLVGHAQLFLLGLQLLALALRLFQQHHQLRTQQRCAQRQADGLGTALQQLAIQITLFTDPGAAQFDDADHGTIAAERRQDALAHRQPAQTGLQFKHGGIVAMQVADPFITSDLPGQPFVQGQRGRRARRQRHATGQLQPSAFQPIDRTDLRVQLPGQARRSRLGDLLRPQVTAQARRHRVLGLLQPERAHGLAAGLDGARDDQRDHQEGAATDGAVDERERRVVAGGRHVEADHQQDTGDHRDHERRARTALEHRDAHGQEIGQPDRVSQRYHQFQRDGRRQQYGRGHPDPAVTRSRTRTHAGRFQKAKGGRWYSVSHSAAQDKWHVSGVHASFTLECLASRPSQG